MTPGQTRSSRFIRQAMVPMRDGIKLATTIFLPQTEGKYPVVLIRTPYNRLNCIQGHEDWTANNFVFIVQDTRGRFDSQGQFTPFLQEIEDTPDMIQWIRQQDWCDQRVGMMGPSYLAWSQTIGVGGARKTNEATTQESRAVPGPTPSSTSKASPTPVTYNLSPKTYSPDALLPTFYTPDVWRNGFYRDGALSFFLAFWWVCFDVGSRTNNSSLLEIFDIEELYRRLPLETLDVSCGAGISQVWRDFMAHPTQDSYWDQYLIQQNYDQFTMPTLQVAGWYDYYPAAMLQSWNELRAAAQTPEIAQNHKILIGPWGHHHDLSPTEDGHRAIDFGPDSEFNPPKIYQAWYDEIFKKQVTGEEKVTGDRLQVTEKERASLAPEESNATKQESRAVPGPSAPITYNLKPITSPPLRLFIMGTNQWRDENEWPLARTKYKNFYLHSKNHLSQQPPQSEPADHYTYDPNNPTPTLGGNHSIGPWNEFYKKIIWCGPCDQRPNEQREDMLIYTTAPLDHDLEVTGPVIVKLFATTDVKDTDFIARLCDVYPDGRSINITEGIIRARYRESFQNPRTSAASSSPSSLRASVPSCLLAPNTTLEYTIDLQATANVFRKGHKIRLQITSSNFPLWDRNLNTGDHPNRSTRMQVASQQIHHDAKYSSHLILPVIE